jgi:uncharacterized protein
MFPKPKSLIGMVHVGALPGSPRAALSISALCKHAADEARILADAGFDALIVENMHDAPYVHGTQSPEVVAAMTRAAEAVRAATTWLPLGVQILSGGAKEALAVALAAGGSFIRCENFVFAHVADEGVLDRAEAGPLLRYRRSIAADDIKIFADLKKKHASHALTADLTLADAAEAATFFGADGVIVTGTATGKPTDPDHVAQARHATTLPVWVGSGVTPDRLGPLFAHADALIVGSWIKHDGLWSNPLDPARCRELVKAADALR